MKIGNSFVRIIKEVVYLFLILFLSYTSFFKMMNMSSFQTNIFKTGVFSEHIIEPLSYAVVISEIILIIILISKRVLGLYLFSLMLMAFTIYISYLNYNQLYEVCGCGGILNGMQYKYHLLVNLGLIAGALFVLMQYKKGVYEK